MGDVDLQRILARLERIPKAVRAALQPALNKSAAEVVATAQSMAPTESGKLKSTIAQEAGAHDLQRRVVAGGSATTVAAKGGSYDYAMAVELGTKTRRAHPFFYPAARQNRKRIRARLKRVASKAIKDIWGKP